METNKAEGTVQQITGKVQDVVGSVMGDTGTQVAGKAKELGGKAQQLYADTADIVPIRQLITRSPRLRLWAAWVSYWARFGQVQARRRLTGTRQDIAGT
jgi:uncharacterized protein YjbJ (UPF0337 family)